MLYGFFRNKNELKNMESGTKSFDVDEIENIRKDNIC